MKREEEDGGGVGWGGVGLRGGRETRQNLATRTETKNEKEQDLRMRAGSQSTAGSKREFQQALGRKIMISARRKGAYF